MNDNRPNFEESIERMAKALEHVGNGDPVQTIELDLQHAIAALGYSPKRLYLDDEPYPEYWDDPDAFPNDPDL